MRLVIALGAALIGCAACTSTPARPAATTAGSPAASSTAFVPALPDRSLASPACSTAAAPAPRLSGVRTAMLPVPGAPFGVMVSRDGRWTFVALGGEIGVLRNGGALNPVKVREISVPGQALGATITADGRYLLFAEGPGAVVISAARAEAGLPGAVLGTLSDPAGDGGAIEIAVSPDGRYAFVTEEGRQRAGVFNLRRALTQGFGPQDYVGAIPLGLAPVGMAVSPDGRWLYATSEAASRPLPGFGRTTGMTGTLTVINLARAETDPAASVAATVPAGCEPVRVITSANGTQVWVTARASDDLLCFSAARLATDPARALVAVAGVGEAPVGLAAVRGGSLIIVADSNRFGRAGATSDLSVVDVAAALAGRRAQTGLINAGGFPREMALAPDGRTLLVTNFSSGQLETVSVPTLPA